MISTIMNRTARTRKSRQTARQKGEALVIKRHVHMAKIITRSCEMRGHLLLIFGDHVDCVNWSVNEGIVAP